MVMQDIVFCAVQYCRAPIEKMLLYKSEEIRFAFITENLKDGGGGREGRLAFQHMLILQWSLMGYWPWITAKEIL